MQLKATQHLEIGDTVRVDEDGYVYKVKINDSIGVVFKINIECSQNDLIKKNIEITYYNDFVFKNKKSIYDFSIKEIMQIINERLENE